jgi:hypothetical protein
MPRVTPAVRHCQVRRIFRRTTLLQAYDVVHRGRLAMVGCYLGERVVDRSPAQVARPTVHRRPSQRLRLQPLPRTRSATRPSLDHSITYSDKKPLPDGLWPGCLMFATGHGAP